MLRVAWITNYDFGHEFRDVASGRTPSHRLMGAAELQQFGHEITYLARDTKSSIPLPESIKWRMSQALWAYRRRNMTDVIVATHEAASVPVLLLKLLGMIRVPVLVMTVAAIPASAHSRGLRGRVIRAALRMADALTTFSSAQVEDLARALDIAPERVRFLPLGVDCEYFSPVRRDRGQVVAAVGTNTGKDFATFVRALPDDAECIIVTDTKNEEVARANLAEQAVEFRSNLPIHELREIYRNCGVMVIPLHDADFSSGQTVLLENLAMNTPVIVSKVPGVADYVDAGVATCVKPGDVGQLHDALAAHWQPTESRSHVLAGFTVVRMARQIESIAYELSSEPRSPNGK